MRPLRAWLLRLRGVFRANRDGQFAEEIEAHLEMHVRDLIDSGLTPDEARRQAIMKLRGVESTRQAYRDTEQLPWVESLLRDCRFTFRTLAKNPAFTVVALAALMLGIGASTAVFSVVESALLRPLPCSDPDRLVWIHDGLTQGDKSGWNACMEDFLRRPQKVDRGLWLTLSFDRYPGSYPKTGVMSGLATRTKPLARRTLPWRGAAGGGG